MIELSLLPPELRRRIVTLQALAELFEAEVDRLGADLFDHFAAPADNLGDLAESLAREAGRPDPRYNGPMAARPPAPPKAAPTRGADAMTVTNPNGTGLRVARPEPQPFDPEDGREGDRGDEGFSTDLGPPLTLEQMRANVERAKAEGRVRPPEVSPEALRIQQQQKSLIQQFINSNRMGEGS